ncbi:MAG: aspartate 1-decarboxylase [Planctomycetota bacterium]
MLRQLLKSKIHRATVTGCSLDYEGSLTVDRELLKRANLAVHEKVLVANLSNGARLETYIIEGGPGEMVLNGAAARLGAVGDKVIVMAFGLLDDAEAASFTPAVVHVDDRNRPTD